MSLVISILKLVGLVLGEIFEAKKRARLKQEKFELTQAKFYEMVDRTLLQMKKDLDNANDQLDDLYD